METNKGYYLLILIPILIYIYAIGFLSECAKPISNQGVVTTDSAITKVITKDTVFNNKENNRVSNYVEQKSLSIKQADNQPECCDEGGRFSYFLLASVFLITLLVLPNLQELSFSNGAFTLKMFDKLKESVDDVESRTVNQKGGFLGADDGLKISLLLLRERLENMEIALKKSKRK